MKKLKDLPADSRPFERCKKFGAHSLTDGELLAMILRTGSRESDALNLSYDLLSGAGPTIGLASLMYKFVEELTAIKGIGEIKAMQIQCVLEIAKRLWKKEILSTEIYFTNPKLCANYYLQDMKYLEREEIRLVFLDSRLRKISDMTLSKGTVNFSLISVRDILIETLKRQAVNVIMIHNHPSGNPEPSEADKAMTKKVLTGLEAIGVNLNDHIVLGDNSYFSFRENHLL